MKYFRSAAKQTIIDKATFQEPAKYAEGNQFVVANGELVVKDGQLLSGVYPGCAVRAPH